MLSKIFLDTTIQIERATAMEPRQAEIAEVLRDKHVMTSTYVLSEYSRTLIKGATLLYQLVEQTEEMYDVETQMAHIFNKGTLSRCLLLWAMLHRAGIYERQMILYSLKMDIQHSLRNRFMIGIDELIDTTCCGLARGRPIREGDAFQLRTQCTRAVKECELVALLAKHRAEIEIVAEQLRGHSDRSLARMAELCAMILEEPDVARGRNCTWYLGDLVIALEAPSDATIYTTNLKHFEPICDCLGKEVYGIGLEDV